MTKIYGIPNCNSMKKAFDYLKSQNIAFEFHDYKKKGITAAKIEEWAGFVGIEKLLNKAGTTYKQLPENEKPTTNEAIIALMMAKPSVIKRPVIELNQKLQVGLDGLI